MKQHGSLVKIDRWWPIGFRWQWRGAATNHIRFPLVAHWRIEAGGAFPNVRFYRQVVRIWRLCIVFGPDRLHDLAERVADLEGRLATATDTIAYMVEENNHTTRAFGDRAAAEHQRAEQLAERVAALENALRAVEDAWEYETDDPGVGDGVFLSNMLRVVMPQVKAALDAAREESGE